MERVVSTVNNSMEEYEKAMKFLIILLTLDDANGNFICYCDEGWGGTRCDVSAVSYANATAELSLEGLLIIIGSIIILLCKWHKKNTKYILTCENRCK